MVILPSARTRPAELVTALGASETAVRDAAVARLRLLGARALPALLAALDEATSTARVASVDVLETLDEPGARAALERLAADTQVAVAQRALEALGDSASVQAARACAPRLYEGHEAVRLSAAGALVRLYAAGVVEALEPLVACLFAPADVPAAVRTAAAGVLAHLPEADARALRERLGGHPQPDSLELSDGDAWTRALNTRGVAAVEQVIEQRARVRAADAAADARLVSALVTLGPAALGALHRALEALGGRAAANDDARQGAAACVHLALAALDSRLALYDLRERLAYVPARHLAALLDVARDVGDAQVALALVRRCAEQAALVEHCQPAFRSIVERERLTRRQAVWRGLHDARERELLGALWPAAPRRARRGRRQ